MLQFYSNYGRVHRSKEGTFVASSLSAFSHYYYSCVQYTQHVAKHIQSSHRVLNCTDKTWGPVYYIMHLKFSHERICTEIHRQCSLYFFAAESFGTFIFISRGPMCLLIGSADLMIKESKSPVMEISCKNQLTP